MAVGPGDGRREQIADGEIVDARADEESISLVQQLLDREAGNPLGARLSG